MNTYKFSALFFFVLLVLSILTSIFYYGKISLLTFINTSFLYSSIFIFISLLLLVTRNGFFDGITYGFRRIFASSQADKELEDDIRNEMRPPSELIKPISINPVLFASLFLFLCMLISLFLFYNS